MHRTLPALLVLAACTGLAETRTYAGPQRPIAGACDPASHATLTRRGTSIVLAPNDGTLTLQGMLAGSELSASTTLTGADKHPYRLTFAGQLAGTQITGTLVTPRCRYALNLALTDD